MITLPDNATIGELFRPAMEITTEAEAKEYLDALVERAMRLNKKLTKSEAEKIEKSNLGYYAGYYDSETSKRVNKLFGCHHPIFDFVIE